jgi:hypothetical protein
VKKKEGREKLPALSTPIVHQRIAEVWKLGVVLDRGQAEERAHWFISHRDISQVLKYAFFAHRRIRKGAPKL